MECATCGNAIKPGQERLPSEDGPRHALCRDIAQTQEVIRYNVRHEPVEEVRGVDPSDVPGDEVLTSLSVFRRFPNEGQEVPVYHEGQRGTFFSQNIEFGDGMDPLPTRIIGAIMHGTHMASCLMRFDPRDETIRREFTVGYALYGGDLDEGAAFEDLPYWEQTLIIALFGRCTPNAIVPPELTPLRDLVAEFSEMPTARTRDEFIEMTQDSTD